MGRGAEERTLVHLKVMSLPALTSSTLVVPSLPPSLQAMLVLVMSVTGPSLGILRTTRTGIGLAYLCGSGQDFIEELCQLKATRVKFRGGYTHGSAKGAQPGWVTPSATTSMTYPWAATEVTAASKVVKIVKQYMGEKSVNGGGVKEESNDFVNERATDKPSGKGAVDRRKALQGTERGRQRDGGQCRKG